MSILLDLVKNLAIQRGIGSLEKRIGQYYSNGDDDTNQFTSNQRDMGLKSILGRTAAFGLLGPILGPIAFALGKGIMNRRNQMSLMPSGDEGPSGIVSGKVQTLDGRIVDAGSDEARADMDRRDQEFQDTGDYDVYSGTTVTTGPDYGPVTSGTVFDAEDDGGGNGGSSSASTAGDAPGYSGPSPFRYGGIASLYR
jgi:hypothetical protein